jgi:antitoxin component of MazEF toxin-antitoxin module
MALEATVRKWGNSYGILLSKAALEELGVYENEKVEIVVKKKPNMMRLFGLCKFDRPTAEIMKEVKEGYNEEKLLRQLRDH